MSTETENKEGEGIVTKEIESHSLLDEIRQTFADYWRSEGCSCCQDIASHKVAEEKLGKLLDAKRYDDGSGFDWSIYYSEK